MWGFYRLFSSDKAIADDAIDGGIIERVSGVPQEDSAKIGKTVLGVVAAITVLAVLRAKL